MKLKLIQGQLQSLLLMLAVVLLKMGQYILLSLGQLCSDKESGVYMEGV